MTSIKATFVNGSIKPWLLLAAALATQWHFAGGHQASVALDTRPATAPGVVTFQMAALGESKAAATAAVLYVQSFDAQAGTAVSIRSLDITALAKWFQLAGDLNPESQYASFLASRIYAESSSPAQLHQLLLWIRDQFARKPAVHWPALAHSVYLARYRLKDMALARQLARDLRLADSSVEIPVWARQMEFFMLRSSNELDAARALLGGLIDSGQVKDERALAVMIGDLKEIERRLLQDERPTAGQPLADKTLENQVHTASGLASDHLTVE